jgi:O-methyltransferase involved in polyketide biosynthesis
VRLAVTRCVPTSLTVSEPVEERLQVELGGVPETLLWTLYHRAVEVRRLDAVLRDPKAVEVVERIDFPFEERFGSGRLGQWQALRVRCFDREIRRFLATHQDGTVVALGEGLETQFWRVDEGRGRWVGVDVPETVALRARLLPDEPRRRSVACSALDERWMDGIDASGGVLVTAQGLLMYFEPPDVHRLIAGCAERFPGGALLFDALPKWLGAASRRGGVKGGSGYRPPPWLWGIDAAEERRLATLHPDIAELRALRLPRGRGALHGLVLPLLSRVPAARRRMLTVHELRFRRPSG